MQRVRIRAMQLEASAGWQPRLEREVHHPGIGKEAGAEWNQREDERSETMVPVVEGKPVWELPATNAEVCKNELEAELRRTRAERYAHLNDRRFEKIVDLVRRRSQTFYMEGARAQ